MGTKRYNNYVTFKKLLFLAFLIGAFMPGLVFAQTPFFPPYEIELIPGITSFDCGYAKRSIINGNRAGLLLCFGLIGNRPSTPPAGETGVVFHSEKFLQPNGITASQLALVGGSTISSIQGNSRLTNVLVDSFDDQDVKPDVAYFNFNNPLAPGSPDVLYFARLQALLTKSDSLTAPDYPFITNVHLLAGLLKAPPPPAIGVSGAGKGDCNNDGRTDVIVPVIETTPAATNVTVLSFIQKGKGGFFEPQRFQINFTDPDGSGPLSPKKFAHGMVRIADIDGDGIADYALLLVRGELSVENAGKGELYLFYGNDNTTGLCTVDLSPTPTPVANFVAGTNPAGLAAADFDNDGLKDFAVLLKGNGGVAPKGVLILYNDGVAPLTIGPLLVRTGTQPTVNPEGLGVGDFDDDGRPDIVFGDSAFPRFYHVRNRIGLPAGGNDFGQVNVVTIGNPVEDIKFRDADFCYGDDVLVLERDGGGETTLSVHTAARPPVSLTVKPGPGPGNKVRITADKPLFFNAGLTNRSKVDPLFKWTVIEAPPDSAPRILNHLAANATFTTSKPGDYKVKLSVGFMPGFKKYGKTDFNCPGTPITQEMTIQVDPAEEGLDEAEDEPSPVFSPDQIVTPGGRACFMCGAPTSGVHQCMAELADGPDVEIECSDKGPYCCFDIPPEEPEEGVITLTVSALDVAGDMIVSSLHKGLSFDETEEEEEEEEESTSDSSQTMTFLVSDDAPISEVTATITGVTETVTAGGVASYALTGECTTTLEGATTTAYWYAEDPDDLEISDTMASETSYVKYLSGETELTLVCIATDDDSGATLVSTPVSAVVTGQTTDEEFSAGNALGGGCSLVR
ncbi:MAG: VCBS repeat-containing protein [Deltaproteobacteria bacterium]|nr:VCBS repeat-containing protein [Deltaproteobacteria bacterium]